MKVLLSWMNLTEVNGTQSHPELIGVGFSLVRWWKVLLRWVDNIRLKRMEWNHTSHSLVLNCPLWDNESVTERNGTESHPALSGWIVPCGVMNVVLNWSEGNTPPCTRWQCEVSLVGWWKCYWTFCCLVFCWLGTELNVTEREWNETTPCTHWR